MPTLDLETSKLIYELVGEYETGKWHVNGSILHGYEGEKNIAMDGVWGIWEWGKPTFGDLGHIPGYYDLALRSGSDEMSKMFKKDRETRTSYFQSYPAPNFGEVCRILVKIGDKKGWKTKIEMDDLGGFQDPEMWRYINRIVALYLYAPTPEKGMEEVGTYLRTLLK